MKSIGEISVSAAPRGGISGILVVQGAGTGQPQEPRYRGWKGGGTDCAPRLAHRLAARSTNASRLTEKTTPFPPQKRDEAGSVDIERMAVRHPGDVATAFQIDISTGLLMELGSRSPDWPQLSWHTTFYSRKAESVSLLQDQILGVQHSRILHDSIIVRCVRARPIDHHTVGHRYRHRDARRPLVFAQR